MLTEDPLFPFSRFPPEPLGLRDPYGRDPYYDRRPDPYADRREYSRERESYRDKPPPDYERDRFDRDRYPPRDDRYGLSFFSLPERRLVCFLENCPDV